MITTQFKVTTVGHRDLDKQSTFACASALTLTGKEIQTANVRAIDEAFTVRNEWDKRGPLAVKVKPATKQNLTAWIGTAFEELEKFVEQTAGSYVIKVPRGEFVAIPTGNVRRTKRDIIRAMQRPRNLRGKRDVVLPMRKGNGLVLFQRQRGPSPNSKYRGVKSHLTALYILVPRVKVKEVDVMFGPAVKIYRDRFGKIFEQQMAKALATAK